MGESTGRTIDGTNGAVTEITALLPSWAWKFIARISKLEPGEVYTVTLFLSPGGEPVWTVQPIGKLENVRGY